MCKHLQLGCLRRYGLTLKRYPNLLIIQRLIPKKLTFYVRQLTCGFSP